MTTTSLPTRLGDSINALLPWAHGHQRKAITTFVAAIIDQQTGCQAALARTQGTQEAAVKRLSRLLHNERLKPKDWRRVALPPGPPSRAAHWTWTFYHGLDQRGSSTPAGDLLGGG